MMRVWVRVWVRVRVPALGVLWPLSCRLGRRRWC